MSSSMSASSKRPRNSQRVSGSPKGACERGAWDAHKPQAYITAKSVRKRWQRSSSDPPRACLSHSKANNTRMGTDRRPRRDRCGKRWAKLCSMAATSTAHGNVSAHWRRGWVSGTKSVTCRRAPVPLNQCWRSRTRPLVSSPRTRGGRGLKHTTRPSSPQGLMAAGNKLVVTTLGAVV